MANSQYFILLEVPKVQAREACALIRRSLPPAPPGHHYRVTSCCEAATRPRVMSANYVQQTAILVEVEGRTPARVLEPDIVRRVMSRLALTILDHHRAGVEIAEWAGEIQAAPRRVDMGWRLKSILHNAEEIQGRRKPSAGAVKARREAFATGKAPLCLAPK